MSLDTKYRKPVPYETELIGKVILIKENSKEKVLVLRHAATGLGSMEFDKAGGCQMLLHRDTFD